MAELEHIEWSRFWQVESGKDRPRVLLVGDSITEGYKQYLGNLAGKEVSVDAYTTSKATDNPLFEKELWYIMEQNHYQVLHFANGLHGFHQQASDYAARYRAVIEAVQKKYPELTIILATSTPVRDAAKEEMVRARNSTVRALAQELHLKVDDLYEVMSAKLELRKADGTHYCEEGYQFLGETVWNLLRQEIGR